MAKFLSKCPNHVLCMIPNRVQIADGIAMPVQGQKIEFVNGEFETEDKKEIEFLRKHRLFGFEITEVKAAEVNEKAGK